MLQIEVGEFKDRQTAVFSIIKEGSLVKERKEEPSPERRAVETVRVAETMSKKTSTNASRAVEKSARDDLTHTDSPGRPESPELPDSSTRE
jgi:hypothetical protein